MQQRLPARDMNLWATSAQRQIIINMILLTGIRGFTENLCSEDTQHMREAPPTVTQ